MKQDSALLSCLGTAVFPKLAPFSEPFLLTFKSLAVTLRTTRFKIKKKNSTWRSLCVECFVRISEQTATFALYWLVFITVVESVYCAVRTDSLDKADYVSSLNS